MKDLSVMIGDYKLNVRVGVVFKHHDKVLIEIRKDRVGNSVIPGGRLKMGESSSNALIREIQEEMGITLDKEKLEFNTTLENFYTFESINYHEIYFLYVYHVDEDFYQKLQSIKENLDNSSTEYIFVKPDEFDEVNLLPLEIRDIIIKSNQ